MTDTPTHAPHLGRWLMLMAMELNKQAEWGVSVGQDILANNGNVWPQLQLFAGHAASVGAFVEMLQRRSRDTGLNTAFPDRGATLRHYLSITYDFAEVKGVRDGMVHIDERLETRWLQLADHDGDAPELLARAEGELDDGRDRMLNWNSTTYTAAFLRADGVGHHFLDVAEVVAVLEDARIQSSRFVMWLVAGAPMPKAN